MEAMGRRLAMARNTARRGAYAADMDFFAWQGEARKCLADLLGMDTFTACDLSVEKEWTREGDGYIETRLTFQTEDNYRAVAHVLIPKGAALPVPVMICLQGHTKGMHISMGRVKYLGDARSIADEQDFARQCVSRGIAAIALEQRGFGERGGTRKGPDCAHLALTALCLGRTLIGERVWDVMRALDMVEEAFPEIDARRIGIMGHSGGGTATIYAASLDERLFAAISSCALCGFAESIIAIRHCACNYVPSVMRWYDMGDLCGLIAPRPLVIVSGTDDEIFPIDSAKREFAAAEALYRASGAADRLSHAIGRGGHRFYAEAAWKRFLALTKIA
ncbi:MAG: alpha/beta hydrolase family protein [Christensenellales bacterium]|jgi:dienelactone hydrolase